MSKVFEVNTASGGSLTTSLVSYWKMADGADFYASNVLTGVNTPTFVAGKIGNGVNYNGSNQYHTLASTITQSGSESIAGWFYIAGDGSVMGKDITVGYNFYFGTNGSNYDIYTGAGTGVEQVSWSIAKASITNIWCHFVLTHDGTNAELFFNGASQGTHAISTLAPIVNIGRAQSTSYMNGKVDELGVWSKVLSANEISDLYNGGSGQTMIGAIAFDAAVARATVPSATSFSVTHTATGSNRIAIIRVYHSTGGGATITGVTYDGVACTKIDTQSNGSGYDEVLWYIVAPATGAKTVTASFSALAFGDISVSTYEGASQTGQPDSYGKGTGTTTGLTVSTTVVASDCWLVGGFETNTTGIAAGTGTKLRATNSDATYGFSTMICDSNGTVATGSRSLVSSHGSALTVGVICSIKPVSTAVNNDWDIRTEQRYPHKRFVTDY